MGRLGFVPKRLSRIECMSAAMRKGLEMELWDAYNEKCERVEGMTLVRGEPIPKGFRHMVCEILVKHMDGTFLLMKRDPRKRHGGLWEATAGGSALVGEEPLECAKRELAEETGIVAPELKEVGRVVTASTIYVEFLCVTDWDKDNITLQEGETVDYRWISRDALIGMNGDELLTKRIQGFIPRMLKALS